MRIRLATILVTLAASSLTFGCSKGEEAGEVASMPVDEDGNFVPVRPRSAGSFGIAMAPPIAEAFADEKTDLLQQISEPILEGELTTPAEPIQLALTNDFAIPEHYRVNIVVQGKTTTHRALRQDIFDFAISQLSNPPSAENGPSGDGSTEIAPIKIDVERIRMLWLPHTGRHQYDSSNPAVSTTFGSKAVVPAMQLLLENNFGAELDKTSFLRVTNYPEGFNELLQQGEEDRSRVIHEAWLQDLLTHVTLPLPSKSLSVSDSWEAPLRTTRFGSDFQHSMTCKFLGTQTVDSEQLAVVELNGTGSGETPEKSTMRNVEYQFRGYAWVRIADGTLMRMHTLAEGSYNPDAIPDSLYELQIRTLVVKNPIGT